LFFLIFGCFAALLSPLTLAASTSIPVSIFDPVTQCRSVSAQTCRIAQELGRGINLGNMLDAPREGDWGVRLDPAYIDKVATVFKTVRIPVRWTNHAAPTADATLDETFAKRVDSAVDAALAKGMYVILDVHHYDQLTGDALMPNEFPVADDVVETRLINIWKQLALRYQNRSSHLIFELFNEPHGKLEKNDTWNPLLAQLLPVVRTSNPTRVVMVGGVGYNSVAGLAKLQLPPDRNLIITFHNYDPFNFTHQGVSYMPIFPAGVTCCDATQRKQIDDAFAAAVQWSKANGYPIHLGEFGSHMKADMASREAYTRIVRDDAEHYGIGWTYWEFASTFGVFDPKAGMWIEPIRRALLD